MKKLLALIVSISAITFFRCSTSTQPPQVQINSKEMSFAIALPCQDKSGPEMKSAVVYVSGSDFDTIINDLSVEPCKVFGTIGNIPPGKDRHIELKIFDNEN